MELNTDGKHGNATLHWKNPRMEIRLRNIEVEEDRPTSPKVHFSDRKGVEGNFNIETGRLVYGGVEVQLPKEKQGKMRSFLNHLSINRA